MRLANGLVTIAITVWSAAAQTGEGLYLSQCAVCHGARGEGGRGAVLARNPLRHASTDESLFRIIRRGLPDSGMPGTALAEGEIRMVMEHVRKLAKAGGISIRGRAQEGARVYHGKGGCAGCHMRNGAGSTAGPDLTGIGERRNQDHLRQSLVDPGAEVPDGFLQLRAVAQSGAAITGTRVNEDSFSVQMRDAAGKLHSFWKSELKELQRLRGQSPMPSYRNVLTSEEIDDLTAFLLQTEVGQ